MRLTAYGNKRIEEMSREELIAALDALWRAYCAINARTIGPDRTELPPSEVDQYQAVLEKWFSPAC